MLDIDENFARFPIALDEHVHRIAVLDPAEKTGARRQGCHGELLNAEMSLGTFLVDTEKSIDETKKLHDSFVLPQVLVS